MRQLIFTLLFAVLFTFTFSNNAYSDTTERLTLNQAIINVLELNPMLKAAGFESQAAAARIRAAKQSPRYHGSIDLENFAGSGLRSGTDALETTLSLSKVLELGDKNNLRGKVSHNKALLLHNTQDAQRLDLLALTTKYFIEVITDQQRLLNAKETVDIATRSKQVVEKRVTAGKAPTAELGRAKITLARSKLKLKHSEHKLEISHLKLASLWGETNLSYATANGNLFDIKPGIAFDALVSLLEKNPDLIRFATKNRLAQSQILLAKSTAQSDIEVSGGVRHFNANDDTALVLSLNIPFGSSSRAQPSIKENELLGLSEPHIYQQQRLTLHSTLFELHHEVKHAADAVTALRQTIIPQAKQVLSDYEKGYAAGRYSYIELSEAQQLLIDLKLETVNTASDYHKYSIEIDRLTGALMPASTATGAAQ